MAKIGRARRSGDLLLIAGEFILVEQARGVYNRSFGHDLFLYLPAEPSLTIKIFTTGGTFDKVYFDALSEFQIGEPMVDALLVEANVNFDYEV